MRLNRENQNQSHREERLASAKLRSQVFRRHSLACDGLRHENYTATENLQEPENRLRSLRARQVVYRMKETDKLRELRLENYPRYETMERQCYEKSFFTTSGIHF